MTDHISSTTLNALADGELSGEQLARVTEHLSACPPCTSDALAQTLLKSAVGRAGQRYALPAGLEQRMKQLARDHAVRPQSLPKEQASRSSWRFSAWSLGGVAAALLVAVGLVVTLRNSSRDSAEYAALVTEVSDQHIATLAANAPPEVISTDRHTVKPWFQGRIPFSFNLPENLPADTTLDGANLVYLHGLPTAQLLYSIGKHHVSVFLQQSAVAPADDRPPSDHSGFHVASFRTPDLAVMAVSDVDPTRLADLTARLRQAQVPSH